ncbi:MAG: hypothetical protein JXB24_00630 [Bacteroidales bacterium]|nr:hypothetical protein [Bacteroidales bacterium]
MSIKSNIAIVLFLVSSLMSCIQKDYDIGYQDDYPNKFAGNWIVFEFPGGEIGNTLYEPYDLVTSLDPNNRGYMIIDKLYNSDTRVRAEYSDSAFYVCMGEQLEQISTNTYDIEYISVDGYITANPVLINMAYNFAALSFESISFEISDIEDIIYMHAGFYDAYKTVVDTVLIIGYRKTGFEETTY